MKLDRNINPDGRVKYALVNMRKVTEIEAAGSRAHPNRTRNHVRREEVQSALEVLKREGVLTLGNETPGDQFFVMKYKDKFTAPGLQGYARAAAAEATAKQDHELKEFAEQMFMEVGRAARLGARIPD